MVKLRFLAIGLSAMALSACTGNLRAPTSGEKCESRCSRFYDESAVSSQRCFSECEGLNPDRKKEGVYTVPSNIGRPSDGHGARGGD